VSSSRSQRIFLTELALWGDPDVMNDGCCVRCVKGPVPEKNENSSSSVKVTAGSSVENKKIIVEFLLGLDLFCLVWFGFVWFDLFYFVLFGRESY